MNEAKATEKASKAEPVITIPDIDALRHRPILQTMASRDCWVKVDFFKDEPVTKEEIFRTMQLLEMMHNGWT